MTAVDDEPSAARRRRLTGPLMLVVGLILSSCALDDNRVRDAPDAGLEAPVVAARCPTQATDVGDTSVPSIASGSRPVGFTDTGLLRCTIDVTEGGDRTTTYSTTVDQGPVSVRLEQALKLADRVFVDPDNGVCSADGVPLPLLLVTDTNARAYRPRLPVTACGKPRPELARAMAELSLTRADSYVLSGTTPR